MKYTATTAWEQLLLQHGAREAVDPATSSPMFICDSLTMRGSGAFDYLKRFYGVSLTRALTRDGKEHDIEGKLCIRGLGRCLAEFRDAQEQVNRNYTRIGG